MWVQIGLILGFNLVIGRLLIFSRFFHLPFGAPLKIKFTSFSFVLLVLVGLTFKEGFAIEQEGFIIERIEAVSNVNVPLLRIKSAMTLREGEPLSEEKLRTDFRALYNLGIFKELHFDLETVLTDKGERVVIRVVVDERFKIRGIRYVGNIKYTEQTLQEDLPLKIDDYYSSSTVNKTVNAIKEKYRKDGYLSTKVRSEIKTFEKKKEVEVLFEITEGSEMLVGKIEFLGITNVKELDLKNVMELHEDKWFREGKYDDLLLEEDKRKIIYYYKKNGYVNAKLLDTKVSYRWRDPAKKAQREVLLTFKIYEGPKFYFGDVSIRGAKLFTEPELRKLLKRKSGEIFNQEVHDKDVQTLGGLYSERGYIFSRVTPLESIDEQSKKISYVFDVYEGEKAHVEKIFITGNDKTKEFVIRRELEIKEGEIFNVMKIRRSVEKAMNLQYFKNVIPDYKAGSVEGLMNLTFNVEEQRTGTISAGLGFGSSSGLSLNAEVKENNLGGLGQTFGLKLEFGQKRKTFSINFTEPWFFKLPVSFGASFSGSLTINGYGMQAFHNELDPIGGTNISVSNDTTQFIYKDLRGNTHSNDYFGPGSDASLPYTTADIGVSVFSSFRFLNWYSLGLNAGVNVKNDFFDKTRPLDTSLPSQDELRKQPGIIQAFNQIPSYLADKPFITTGNLSLTLARDTRDNNLNTTRGSLLSLTSTLIFIDNDLTRWSFQYAKYVNPLWKFVIAYQFDLQSLGYSPAGFKFTSDQLYFFNREEMRGWEYGDIIGRRVDLSQRPAYKDRQFTSLDNSSYYLGEAKVRHSLELRFPIFEQALWGLGFIDAGNLSVKTLGLQQSDLDFLLPLNRGKGSIGGNLGAFVGEYLFDMGLGLRLQIPAFPIRLYVSWKFAYNSDTGYFEWKQPAGKYLFKDESLLKVAAAYRALGDETKAKEREEAYTLQGNGSGIPEPTIIFNVFGYF